MLRKRSEQAVSLSTTYWEEKGFVLISSLILIALLTVIGMTGLTMTDLEVEMSANQHSTKQAFYLADSGIQRAIKKLADDNTWPSTLSDSSDAFIGGNALGDGSYVVEVFDDDPIAGQVRIRSTGITTGFNGSSATLEVTGIKLSFPSVFEYASFSCGNLELDAGTNEIRGGDVYTSGNLDMTGSDTNLIENADVYALGNVNLDTGQILNGDAFSNANANLNSSGSPNVGGNVTAGGSVNGPGTVTGMATSGASPEPVADLCTGPELADLGITEEAIQDYRDNADTTISGGYNQSGGVITYTGIVHITDNMDLSGNLELSGDVIFIVDGNVDVTGPGSIQSNPLGSTVTFIVPYNNFNVKGGGDFVIDGAVQVGTVNEDGSNIQGGNIDIQDDSTLDITGSAVALNGNVKSSGNSAFTIDYVTPTNSNLSGNTSNGYTALQWREVRN